MESKSPVRLKTGCANNTSVILADYLLRGRSAQEVEIEASTDSAVGQAVSSQEPVLTMCVAGVDAVGCRAGIVGPVPGLYVHWVRVMTVDVNFLIVVEVVCVPKRLCPVVTQPEAMDASCESVNVVVWYHVRHQFQELVLEDDLVSISVEEDLAGAGACDAELEAWLVGPGECQITLVFAGSI